jgi:hypothetical protein
MVHAQFSMNCDLHHGLNRASLLMESIGSEDAAADR